MSIGGTNLWDGNAILGEYMERDDREGVRDKETVQGKLERIYFVCHL
jgi:hypothetical protein